MTVRVADIAFDPRTVGKHAIYTYQVEEDAKPGHTFLAPLGTRSLVGVAIRVYDADEERLGFPLKSLRSVEAPVVGVEIPPVLLEMAQLIDEQYLCDLATALTPVVPPGIKDRVSAVWSLTDVDPGKLSPVQAEVVQVLRQLGDWVERKNSIEPSAIKQLKALRKKGIVRRTMRLPSEPTRKKALGLITLCHDAEKIERFLKEEGKKKPAQAMVLMQLQEAASSAFEPHEVKAMAGVTDATLKALVQTGLLEEASAAELKLETAPQPNPHQRLAIEAISEAVRNRAPQSFLLYGVTGSGKTEVYLRAVSEALQAGRQALYLVPEIALATQSIARLRARFGSRVAVLHSELTPKERLSNWLRIRSGECPVVLGARSAIFAPLDNLGLIVLDEEHEASYKQESAPRYHTKRLSLFLRDWHKCPVVFGSATPSLETYHEAEQDQHTLITLPTRAQDQALPPVRLVDLAEGFHSGTPALLASPIPERLAAVIEKGQQAILFLNRRAYAPFLLCRDCGERLNCPRCAVALSFHRGRGWMVCHQCGFHAKPPDVCPKCDGTRLKPMGIGTEKVEEVVKELLPNARVARLDRDVAQRKGAVEEVLTAFRAGDLDVLVGTQMVAKGLDFPNVTLVVVVSADVSLGVPDFRASERTFQLLSQVAGRAGRGGLAGEVFIQTFSPEHLAVTAAQDHDYPRFFEAMREDREDTRQPPFCRFVNIVASGPQLEPVKQMLEKLARELLLAGFDVLGPADCPLERVQNRWRKHILIKLPLEQSPATLRPFLREVSFAIEAEGAGLQLMVDVDAYSMM